MTIAKVGRLSGLVFFLACKLAAAQQPSVTVSGRLVRTMAVGGESSGWMVELGQKISVENQQVSSVEIESRDVKQFEALEQQNVEGTGAWAHRSGVERGDRVVLAVSSIRKVGDQQGAPALGGSWRLTDLNGHEVLNNVQATIEFLHDNRVAGRASCNRFFGSVQIQGHSIHFTAMGSSRIACAEPVMKQEDEYLKALQAAERFEVTDDALMIYCKGFDKPLRFTRQPAEPPQ